MCKDFNFLRLRQTNRDGVLFPNNEGKCVGFIIVTFFVAYVILPGIVPQSVTAERTEAKNVL